MRRSSNPNFMLGYSDTETVKLDFDQTPFKVVKRWADRATDWFKLEGYVILKSSKNSYHVVFNRTVMWKENIKIVAWVCLHSRHRRLLRWFLMQCIKSSSTLRISPKGKKPTPRIVLRQGDQDKQTREFMASRNAIKSIIKSQCSP